MRGRCAAGFCRVPGRRGGGVRQRREHRRDGGRHPGHNAVADGPGAHRDAHTARPPTLGTTGAPALLGESVTTPAGPKLVLVNTSSRPVTLKPVQALPCGVHSGPDHCAVGHDARHGAQVHHDDDLAWYRTVAARGLYACHGFWLKRTSLWSAIAVGAGSSRWVPNGSSVLRGDGSG